MRSVIIEALKGATGRDEIGLEFSQVEFHGDYSSNIALVLAKESGGNPKVLGEEIAEKLRKDKELSGHISKIEVAGPGFINFFLSEKALLAQLASIEKEKEAYGTSDRGKGKTVVIDYSSPNIAKRFGVGHIRSTIIGQVLYNLHKFLGYKVIGDNHLGDWGTQFGTLLYQIDFKGLDASKLTIDELEKLYVEFNSEAEKNERLWEMARAWFKKLEEKDPKAREIWKQIVNISMAEFSRIYETLGVKIDYIHGESFFADKMSAIIEEARMRQLSKKSEGAEIVEFKGLPPAMLVKSDGTTTYFTRDLATIKFRIAEWNPDLIIYEVGSDQTLHFRQLFETARLLGWAKGREFVHVAHGLIRFEHGKMSTRRGETIRLEEVLDDARARAKGIIDKSETGRGLLQKEKEKVAKAVGIGAVKYFDLKHHPTTDIIFDWEKIFVLQGNSAPYLQYTVARTNSVLAKAQTVNSKQLTVNNLNDEEKKILRSFSRFSEIIATAAKSYSPNLLANYLFDLAQKYNNFYNQHRIIGGENEAFKLRLTSAIGQVLKNGLTLLGIETPERM
ncbi:MAG: arginine--tRNA ligase [Patescibacteria group bacterium]|mgnify:CR=1 FL=1